jgi:N-acetyl-anhydromuramyl-L-alanine amidase AmpD
MSLPDDVLERDAKLLEMVRAGNAHIEYVWLDLDNGLEIQVTRDAVRFDGVRYGTTAYTQQLMADHEGAVLLTPKLCDLVAKAALRCGGLVPPNPQPINSLTAGYKKHSEAIGGHISASLTPSLEAPRVVAGWKDWVLSKDIWAKRKMVTNYGWHAPTGTSIGLRLVPSVSDSELEVVQAPHEAHTAGEDIDGDGYADTGHADYSQLLRWAKREAKWQGDPVDLADVYTGCLEPEATEAASHEGALPGWRLPGVPLYGPGAPESLGEPPENPPRITRKGERGVDVVAWQQWLLSHGYELPKYGADGHHGDETEAATRAYLSDHDADPYDVEPAPLPPPENPLDPALVAMKLEDLPGKQAKYYAAGRDNSDLTGDPTLPLLVVIHTAECSEHHLAAEGLGNYAATMADGRKVSWHYSTDNDSMVCSVWPDDTAYHAGPGNEIGIGIELAGRSSQGAAGWADTFSTAQLELTAALVAALCERYDISARKLDPIQLLQRPMPGGVVGHADISKASLLAQQRGDKYGPWWSRKRNMWRRTTHLDPGPTFDWPAFIERVRQYLSARIEAMGNRT